MATPILVIGNPGTGKTASIRNLDPKETFIIHCDMKPLTIPKSRTNYKTVYKENGKIDLQKSNYYETVNPTVVKALLKEISESRPDIKNVVIDTITSLMTSEFFSRLKEKGYEKYNDLALETYDILTMLRPLRTGLNVIVMSHCETKYDHLGIPKTSFKVPAGKLVGEKFEPEAGFHMVLYTDVVKSAGKTEYTFLTQNNNNTGRTPLGMYDTERIPNDLSEVISTYEQYEL